MKKKFIVFFAAMAIMFGTALSSCSKSNQDLLNDYKELCQKAVEAVKDGDQSKLMSISEEGKKVEEELQKRDLTEEEKTEFAKITTEFVSEVAGAAGDMLGL